MEFNILKEKDTWILGTWMFLGFFIGIMISPLIDFKPNLLMKIILLVVSYFLTVVLVALIKLSDRLTLSLREDD